jgi:hypothetical protein
VHEKQICLMQMELEMDPEWIQKFKVQAESEGGRVYQPKDVDGTLFPVS